MHTMAESVPWAVAEVDGVSTVSQCTEGLLFSGSGAFVHSTFRAAFKTPHLRGMPCAPDSAGEVHLHCAHEQAHVQAVLLVYRRAAMLCGARFPASADATGRSLPFKQHMWRPAQHA